MTSIASLAIGHSHFLTMHFRLSKHISSSIAEQSHGTKTLHLRIERRNPYSHFGTVERSPLAMHFRITIWWPAKIPCLALKTNTRNKIGEHRLRNFLLLLRVIIIPGPPLPCSLLHHLPVLWEIICPVYQRPWGPSSQESLVRLYVHKKYVCVIICMSINIVSWHPILPGDLKPPPTTFPGGGGYGPGSPSKQIQDLLHLTVNGCLSHWLPKKHCLCSLEGHLSTNYILSTLHFQGPKPIHVHFHLSNKRMIGISFQKWNCQ